MSSLDTLWTLTCGNGFVSTDRTPGIRLGQGVTDSRRSVPESGTEEVRPACRIRAENRFCLDDWRDQQQFASPFTRRLLCQLSYTGGRLGAW